MILLVLTSFLLNIMVMKIKNRKILSHTICCTLCMAWWCPSCEFGVLFSWVNFCCFLLFEYGETAPKILVKTKCSLNCRKLAICVTSALIYTVWICQKSHQWTLVGTTRSLVMTPWDSFLCTDSSASTQTLISCSNFLMFSVVSDYVIYFIFK